MPRKSATTRRAVSAVAVIAALASAAPIAGASAATIPPPSPALPGLANLPAFSLANLPAFTSSPLALTIPGVTVSQGPTVIGQTFTGDTTVCVAPTTHCSP